jgi:hypothetical protein
VNLGPPELGIRGPHSVYPNLATDEELGGCSVESKAYFLGPGEVVVVSFVAKTAGCHHVVRTVTVRMAFRDQVVNRKHQPNVEGLLAVGAAISTDKEVPLVNLEAVSAKRVLVVHDKPPDIWNVPDESDPP